MLRILEALTGLVPRQPIPHDEMKASRTAGLVTFNGPSEPIWSPRDYATFAREGFAQNAIVYRSVRMISEAAASIPLMLFEGDSEHYEHPFLELMAQPCPDATGTDILECFFGHLLVAGNAYVEAVAVDNELRELHVLRPDRMKVIPGHDGWPEGYEYTAGGRSVRFNEEVVPDVRPILHMRLFHPANDHYGMSPIEAAATAIDIHNEAASWNKALLDNAARPSGALVYAARDSHLTGEQYERLKTELEAGFAGARNAGRPLLLEGGLDWKPLSLSPKDMDFIEAKHAAAREIALAMGVPPMLLGIPGDNTYSNYQEANRSFWRQTVLPLAKRTAKALSRWLAPAFGADTLELRPDIDAIEALSGEREALWARLEGVSFLTKNEKRIAAGYEALGEETGGELDEGDSDGADDEAGGAEIKATFDVNQPRVPAGDPDGGQWTDGGGGGGTSQDDGRIVVAGGKRNRGAAAPKPGRIPSAGGRPAVVLRHERDRLNRALQRLREIDPDWRPAPSFRAKVQLDSQEYRRLRSLSQEAEARITYMERGGLPYGFQSRREYRKFGAQCRAGFHERDYRDAEPYLRGSAVTGRSYKEGRPFDGGPRPSDLDIAIVSRLLMERAEQLRVPLLGRRTRTRALTDRDLESLGIYEHATQLSRRQKRPVSFMIYRSHEAVEARGPHRRLPKD
jgi:HK97 family phage portal protein